jgi:hypothetical protein
MDKFTITVTEVYFSKMRVKLLNIFTLSFGVPIFAFLLFTDITGYIPLELKFIPFLGQTILTVVVFVAISFILIYVTISTSDKSFDGTIQINDKGLRFDFGKRTRQIPWTFITNIEIHSDEWKLLTKKKVFWVKFDYSYERHKADVILKEKIAAKQLTIGYEQPQGLA